MGITLPPSDVLWRAIDLYIQNAYDGPPRASLAARLDALRNQPPDALPTCSLVEQDVTRPGNFRIRLGNHSYPHMKLAVQLSPDGSGSLFKCDTHDRHCCPGPASPEYAAFLRLMQANEVIAHRIESAWEAAGVPTFKQFLRDDLARRRAALNPTAP